LALGWTIGEVEALDGHDLATVVDVLNSRGGRRG
jgi:hypothetical protein